MNNTTLYCLVSALGVLIASLFCYLIFGPAYRTEAYPTIVIFENPNVTLYFGHRTAFECTMDLHSPPRNKELLMSTFNAASLGFTKAPHNLSKNRTCVYFMSPVAGDNFLTKVLGFETYAEQTDSEKGIVSEYLSQVYAMSGATDFGTNMFVRINAFINFVTASLNVIKADPLDKSTYWTQQKAQEIRGKFLPDIAKVEGILAKPGVDAQTMLQKFHAASILLGQLTEFYQCANIQDPTANHKFSYAQPLWQLRHQISTDLRDGTNKFLVNLAQPVPVNPFTAQNSAGTATIAIFDRTVCQLGADAGKDADFLTVLSKGMTAKKKAFVYKVAPSLSEGGQFFDGAGGSENIDGNGNAAKRGEILSTLPTTYFL